MQVRSKYYSNDEGGDHGHERRDLGESLHRDMLQR
jgi:hypothetical protein